MSKSMTSVFFVGEPKSGTSSFWQYFSQHPSFSVPDYKEPKYFCTDMQYYSDRYHGFQKGFPIRTKEDYDSIFPSDGTQVFKIDCSPHYIVSETAARNIYEYDPNAKIIISLREPISYLISLHNQLLKSGNENIKNPIRAFKREPFRRKGRYIPKSVMFPEHLYYSWWVEYSSHVKRMLDIFPAEQVKIIIYEEYKEDNFFVLNEILDFLGAPDFDFIPISTNERVSVRFVNLRNLLIRIYQSRFVKRYFPNNFINIGKRVGNIITKGRANKEEITHEDREWIMNYYELESEKDNLLWVLERYGYDDAVEKIMRHWEI